MSSQNLGPQVSRYFLDKIFCVEIICRQFTLAIKKHKNKSSLSSGFHARLLVRTLHESSDNTCIHLGYSLFHKSDHKFHSHNVSVLFLPYSFFFYNHMVKRSKKLSHIVYKDIKQCKSAESKIRFFTFYY